MAEPALVAVDWGTSRLRAALLDETGEVLERSSADEGIMHVEGGRWAETLDRHVGAWLRQKPAMKVVMAGMIGSRNGWVEVPYVDVPAGSLNDGKVISQGVPFKTMVDPSTAIKLTVGKAVAAPTTVPATTVAPTVAPPTSGA